MQRDRRNSADQVQGTWKLQSFTTEDLGTGQISNLFGTHPSGFLNYGPDGRMYAILLKEGRTAPVDLVATSDERIDLYSGLCSYAGTYSIEGDRVSHHIDASWNESWTGTTQVREFRIDGNTLSIKTLPYRNPLTGQDCTSELVWVKLE